MNGNALPKPAAALFRDDDNFVEASLLGFFDFEVGSGRLVTTEATYGRTPFGVAVRTVAAGQ